MGIFVQRRDVPGMTDTSSREYIARICHRLRELRESRDLSRRDMATALGVSLDAYTKWESRTPIPVQYVERAAIILGCDVTFLITGHGAKPKSRDSVAA